MECSEVQFTLLWPLEKRCSFHAHQMGCKSMQFLVISSAYYDLNREKIYYSLMHGAWLRACPSTHKVSKSVKCLLKFLLLLKSL